MDDNRIQSEIQRGKDEQALEDYATLLAGVIAAFYVALVEGGVPPAIAETLTTVYEQTYLEKTLNPRK